MLGLQKDDSNAVGRRGLLKKYVLALQACGQMFCFEQFFASNEYDSHIVHCLSFIGLVTAGAHLASAASLCTLIPVVALR